MLAPGPGAFAATVSPAPAPAGMPATAPAPVGPPTPPPATGVPGFSAPYAVGPPGLGAGGNLSAGTRAGQTSPDFATAAAPAAADRREQVRRRRRPRPGRIDPGYRHEYLDTDPGGGPASVTASDRGAGPIGFAGTTGATGSAPVGLTTVAGDALDDGPRMPLLPGSWSAETEDPENGQVGGG
ncbi:PPE family protein [Mycobacterium avium subsp. paratuberculosis]|nr:PPE family protein [Mycobacterium avium subsp. paratuberculosis]